MTLMIGKTEFEVDSLYSIAPLRDVWRFAGNVPGLDTVVYAWKCREKPRVDPEGLVTFAVDCDVQFPVVQKKNPFKLNEKKSKQLRKKIEALTGLKGKDLIEVVRTAVKPVQVKMDARPTIDRVGKYFSFEVTLFSTFQYYVLRPKGDLDAAYMVVGIPGMTAFFTKIIKVCRKPENPDDKPHQWVADVTWDAQHLVWEKAAMAHEKAEAEAREKQQRKDNKKKGVREIPKTD